MLPSDPSVVTAVCHLHVYTSLKNSTRKLVTMPLSGIVAIIPYTAAVPFFDKALLACKRKLDTVVPTKSDSDVVFCLQSLGKTRWPIREN